MKKQNEKVERTNVSLGEVTVMRPFLIYAICVNAENRPGNHVGDWPEEGKAYPIHIVNSLMEGQHLVHVLGFKGEAPYFNAFSPERFSISTAHTIPHLMGSDVALFPIFLN